jgi:phosphatidate cytidylyltransferase
MLRERVAIVLFITPFLVWIIADGNWLYTIAITTILSLASIEYGSMFRRAGFKPSLPMLVFGVIALVISRFLWGFKSLPLLLAVLFLLTQVWHMVDYERGAQHSATDFAISSAGILYIGLIGSYLISLRRLPEGEWWFLITFLSIWIADSAAYLAGKAFGRRQLTPRLSPNKTWEGYLAGVIFGAVGTMGFTILWRIGAGPQTNLTLLRGLTVGALISIFAPLGDLGVSMIKRELQVKDSGSSVPGHGGVLDRIDSWLWAGVLGFYIVSWLIS